MKNWRVRDAVAEDVPDILRMIKELAVYEKELESRVKLTEEEMLRDGFGDQPWFECLIAEEILFNEGNNCLPKKKPVGYAFFFYIYSTREGRSLYLEDLYVNPAFRENSVPPNKYWTEKLRLAGRGKRPNKARQLSKEEEEILWKSEKLDGRTPEFLIHTMWWLLTQQLGLCGRQEYHRMRLENFRIMKGKGIGTDMLKRVSAIAVDKSCARVDWSCLNWNKTAKDFYGKLGAVYLDEVERYRLTGERLLEFAAKKPE